MKRTMSAEEALTLFESVALPVLGRAFALNTCIEQTRILIDVLAAFGIAAEPLATKLHLVCIEKEFQFFVSGDPDDLVRVRQVKAGYKHRGGGEETIGYHTVALVERRLLVDLTLAQASCPEFGFHIEPCIVVIDLQGPLPEDRLPDIHMGGINDDGLTFTVRWAGDWSREFESAPGWEPSHLRELIRAIIVAMRVHQLTQQPEVV